MHRGVVFFSNFHDQRLYRHTPGAGEPVPITPETGGAHRFADGRVTADGAWWLGVRERHVGERVPEDVLNELVAIPTDGSAEPRVIASGRDFYSDPRISPDGTKLCFLAWDLPWMPWDGTELFVADLAADGTLGEPRHVAGRGGEESIWQPTWSPGGELYWASDRSDRWNLERERDGERADGASGAGRVRLAAVDLRGVVVRVPRRRPDRVPLDGRRGRPHRDPRSGDRRAHRDGPAADRGPASEPRGRGDVGGVRRRVALDGAADRAARPDDAVGGRPPREQPGRRRSRVPVHAGADRVPDGGRADRVRALLSPLERRLPRPRGGAPAPDRDEPRRADVAGRPVAGRRDPVLDQPRLRRGRRELRGQHRVRPRVPAAPQRQLGGRRHDRLHQRRPLPGGRGTGGRGEARDPGRRRPAGTRRSAR